MDLACQLEEEGILHTLVRGMPSQKVGNFRGSKKIVNNYFE